MEGSTMNITARLAGLLNGLGKFSADHGGPDWFIDTDGAGRTWFDHWQDGGARYYTVGRLRLTIG